MKDEHTLDCVGPFTVTIIGGRNYLYYGEDRIAKCINGDYVKRFGGIEGWLKHIKNQDHKRIDKIIDLINDLSQERGKRSDRISNIQHILTHGEK